MKQAMKAGRKIGAIAGAIFFLAFGIGPGFFFGTTGALMTLNHLMGHAAEPTILARLFMVAGAAIGLACTLAVSIVIGSLAGTVLGYVSELIGEPAESKEKAESRT